MAGGTRTVAYDRWYLDEVERAEAERAGPRAPAPRVRVDKREADPRRALATAAERSGEGLAALSRMIWRHSRYLDRFVREGRPAALTREEHAKLAAFFGVDERALGIRDLWAA